MLPDYFGILSNKSGLKKSHCGEESVLNFQYDIYRL